METILITTSSFALDCPELLDDLKKRGFQYRLNPYGRVLKKEELASLLDQCRPVGMLAGTEPIREDVLTGASGFLRVISRVGVGWNNVDLEAASSLGIRVFRTEGVLTHAVAELAMGMMLAALRDLARHDRFMRDNIWKKGMGSLLAGKTVGLVGFGEIGQRVGFLVSAFGAQAIYCDPRVNEEVAWARKVTLEELLARAEIISLHADSKGVILGDGEFKKCRPGVILINTARGGLVDEDALYRHLSEGRVGFACLDVFRAEPYSGPLRELNNVLLTPHIGSYAREARREMERHALDNLYKGLREAGCI